MNNVTYPNLHFTSLHMHTYIKQYHLFTFKMIEVSAATPQSFATDITP